RLPNLVHLLGSAKSSVMEAGKHISANSRNAGVRQVELSASVIDATPECEEVLAICRHVFEAPLGLDDRFVDSGGHSIAIARLAQKLQLAGWMVSVRALLGDCDTARKVASRPRTLQQLKEPAVPSKFEASCVKRDERAAALLPIGYFTGLQVLF